MTQPSTPTDPEALLAHGDFVRAVARSLLFDEHAADDVVQQTWIAALGAPSGASRGWLAAVARNLAIKRLRGDRRRAVRESAAARPEGVPSAADVLERERLRRSVVDAVLALDEPYRATVLLRWFDGLPPREAARRMGVPVETVRTRTRRALGLLRARLDERHGADRRAFGAALFAWAGKGRGGATAAGGTLMASSKTVVACAAVAAGILGWLLWPRGDGAPAQSAERATASNAPAAATRAGRPPAPARATERAVAADAGTRDAAPPAESVAPSVRGRVVDADGRPFAQLPLFVAGEATHRPDADPIRLTTDAEGRFEAKLPSAGRCVVLVPLHPAVDRSGASSKEVEAPADGVELLLKRRPTATLVVTAFDVESAKPVADFSCRMTGQFPEASVTRSEAGRVERLVTVPVASGGTIRVTVSTPDAAAERDVAVRADDRVEVRVDLSRGVAVTGRVVGDAGRPLAGAIVFFGEEDVARGDEPFKPFNENRLKDAVRSDADGRFELRGKGRVVTVWHAERSPVTVPLDGLGEVTLPPRGAIRGVLRDAGGTPVASSKVVLDRTRETATDAAGRFEFVQVEAGTRGLSLEGPKARAYVGVRVGPGETTDVDLRPGIPDVRISWSGRTDLGQAAVLVALGPVGSMTTAQPTDGGFAAADVLPGRYLLLTTSGGVATVEVAGRDATVVAGHGEIVVRAAPRTRVYVVPERAGYLARLIAGRMTGAGVPAGGVQRFSDLAPGRYEVGVERGGVRAVVEVKDGPVETAID